MADYTDTIRQWATDDRRAGTLADADGIGEIGLGVGEAGKRLAVRFAIRVRDNRVDTVRYQVFGCGFTIAACAAAADLAEGHHPWEITAITPKIVAAALAGLPPERDYCAELAVEALRAAIKSAVTNSRPVRADRQLAAAPEDTRRATAANPVYRLLTDSPPPPGAPVEDRHLFACLLAAAAAERGPITAALGLSGEELADLLHLYFPAISADRLASLPRGDDTGTLSSGTVPAADLLHLLHAYLPSGIDCWTPAPAIWLVRIIAARSLRPGHLWIAMGLFSRQDLSMAIARHLPALATANNRGMRWKRFLFKQLCEQSGGLLCKAPNCGVCSDYALCFDVAAIKAES